MLAMTSHFPPSGEGTVVRSTDKNHSLLTIHHSPFTPVGTLPLFPPYNYFVIMKILDYNNIMFDFLFVIFNEIRSYFVPEKVSYEITGECKKCGKCCNYMYSYDTYTEKEFKIMQFLFPAYKRFYIKGKDNEGNLIFACKLVTPDGLCSDYEHRLKMCKNYPAKRIFYPAKLHEGCGYKVNIKTFDDYLHKNI